MSSALLLDTHIALWLANRNERLKPSTRALIDECWLNGGTLFLSAVSAWEIAMLVDAGRIALNLPVDGWVQSLLNRPGVVAAPLTPFAAARSYQLQNLQHRDPADRLLIATAIELGCPLVTYDESIMRFAESAGRQHGFATAS